ncbi:MAG: hypothetical protein ABIJ34_02970 [archaeon]
MELSKKGVFFTFIAIFLVVLIISAVATRKSYRYTERTNSISTRIDTLNDFIEDYQKEVDRELFIGGYRSLISMNAYTRITQGYLTEVSGLFTEILVNGTANGTQMDLMKQEGIGADIESWLVRVNEEANLLNIHVDVTVNSVSLSHISPWEVDLRLNMTSHIYDNKGIASWEIGNVYSRVFSIQGFEDPLYTIGSGDKMTVLINETPSTDFVDDVTNDTTTLISHITRTYYISSNTAPSWLMRFTGNLSPSEYGIESLVDISYLSSQGRPIEARSIVDYIYFANETTTDYCTVQNMPEWFRIDDDHLEVYEIDRLTKVICT